MLLFIMTYFSTTIHDGHFSEFANAMKFPSVINFSFNGREVIFDFCIDTLNACMASLVAHAVVEK